MSATMPTQRATHHTRRQLGAALTIALGAIGLGRLFPVAPALMSVSPATPAPFIPAALEMFASLSPDQRYFLTKISYALSPSHRAAQIAANRAAGGGRDAGYAPTPEALFPESQLQRIRDENAKWARFYSDKAAGLNPRAPQFMADGE